MNAGVILSCNMFAESNGLPKQPSLELAIGQAHECMRLMSRAGVAACAFANITDCVQH